MHPSRIGPFALEEPLDNSKVANVFRGVHVERQASMAIKLLPRQVARSAMGKSSFATDLKQLQQLDHPGIARVYGGAIEQGQPYLVLELIHGETLQDLIHRRVKLPWEMATEIVDALAEALSHAHERGIVHQRLTPERILLPNEGGVKITGFDCKWADRDAVAAARCPMRIAHYLSPEQFRGRQSAQLPQCDLYSLGVILYECLTGEMPWLVNTAERLRQARRKGPAPRISAKVLDCPVWIDPLAEKLLAKVRSERFQTAEEAHRALVLARSKAHAGTGTSQDAWSGKQGALARDQDRSELTKLKRRRSTQRDESPFYERAWFLALCLALVVGLGVWSLWPADEATLFAKAKPLMESESSVDWKRALDQYLLPLQARFPNTEYADEIQELQDRYAMHRAEERIKNLNRFGRQPKTEAERAFAEAWEYERFGDRMTAWQKYDSLVHLFATSENSDDQIFAKLAQRQIKRIKLNQQDSADQLAFLEQSLAEAKNLANDGKLLEARRVLDSIISLYSGNQELKPFVDRARAQLLQLDAGNAN